MQDRVGQGWAGLGLFNFMCIFGSANNTMDKLSSAEDWLWLSFKVLNVINGEF